MKIKSLFNLFFISLFFLLNGCNNPKPTFQDFIGTWVSEDGGEIILRSDSTCVCKNIRDNYINIFSEKKHKRYFFKEAPVNSVPLYPKYSPRIHKEADKAREKTSDRIREFQLTVSQGG